MNSDTVTNNTGVTDAERYLGMLCNRTFLSLWSYPNIYRDQGRGERGQHGKEICDLLVVFRQHIIIFSDKHCKFPDTGDIKRDWDRWFRRAVADSARQIWGAERWIKSFPDNIYLDKACTQRFPLDLPKPSIAKFHRILVAHGACERCRKIYGGSGSLMMFSNITGDMHYSSSGPDWMPFTIGQIDESRGFIHVLDDASLRIVMSNLDTISDFVDYLECKEKFIHNNQAISAAGEEELLALYLPNRAKDGKHDFIIPPGFNIISASEGCWESFSSRPERIAQLEAERISYVWDLLIETFNHHISNGTSYQPTERGINHEEKIVRFLAGECRDRRVILVEALKGVFERSTNSTRNARVVFSKRTDDPCYVFVFFPREEGITEEEYRDERRALLRAYTIVTKHVCPDALDIIGIAASPDYTRRGSLDIIHLDTREWTPKQEADAIHLQRELGLLSELNETKYTGPGSWCSSTQNGPLDHARQESFRMKGRDRNQPCPCGSGQKFKRCCGRTKTPHRHM